MEQIKIVFSDIDGTLLTSSHRFPPQVVEAVAALGRQGIPFILVSSRPPLAMDYLHEELGLTTPMVSYGGALVRDGARKEMQSTGIDQETAIAMQDYITVHYPKVMCNSFSYEAWLADDVTDPRVVEEQAIVLFNAQQGSIRELLPPGQCLHKLQCFGEPDDILEAEAGLALLNKDGQFSICRSSKHCIEIMKGGVSKGKAVRFLCEHYGVSPAQAVAFGDNFNDLEMLKTVGTGVAMGNAPAEIRAQMAYTAPDNDHAGVADFLHKYVLHNTEETI